VIAEVKKTIPNKPIRYLVNTHNHFDHLGGTRTYVAQGATVITDDKNREFYQQVVLAPQPRTLSPDRLSQYPFAPTGPGTLALQTFSDRYTISDGQKAIALLSNEPSALPPTCVLLDIKLPSLSGFEVLSWIRQQPGLKRLPVVMLTSSTLPSDINQAYDLGANSYLVKPPSLETLIELAKTIDLYWLRTNTPPH